VDLADGYIHFSTADQFAETLQKHFSAARDLVCLTVDLDMLGAAVRWEHSRGGNLFPHLYAPLPVNAVRAVRPIPDDAAGRTGFQA
jgi:uncharacterized protein (DUF952 family)